MLALPAADRPAPSFLVSPPDFYDAHFLFNPFMSWTDRVDRRRARSQWRRLVAVLEQAGARVEVAAADDASAELPFTADGAFVFAPGRALVLRNDGPRGELEPPVFKRWLESLGYQTESLPPAYRLDGGNLVRLPSGDVLAGAKPGASGLAERYLGKLLARSGRRLWPVPLADGPFLHLDTVLGVLGPHRFLVYRDGLVHREGLGGSLPEPLAGAEVIEVSRADAERFACNVVVVGDVVVTGPISDGLARRIGRLGYAVERLDLSEFYKAGGGAKCLTLPLDPDWRWQG
jgi:N-dimethylarginine dimethylaminohydrolase